MKTTDSKHSRQPKITRRDSKGRFKSQKNPRKEPVAPAPKEQQSPYPQTWWKQGDIRDHQPMPEPKK